MSAGKIGLVGIRAGAALALLATQANAAVTISNGATKNMACASGVCSPTKTNAVLNVGDLQTMLASGNAEVTTTGTGAQAKDIVVSATLSWVSPQALTLDAYRSLTIDKTVADNGSGALSLVTDDGGTNGELSFGAKGNVSFLGTGNALTINGTAYTLVNSVQGLASAIVANPTGYYALAANYNAKPDGAYSSSPVGTIFSGRFEGLGNTISHVKIKSTLGGNGFFYGLDTGGQVRDFGLDDLELNSRGRTGGLASFNRGTISRCYVTGSVTATHINSIGGGLVGLNAGGVISQSYTTAAVAAGSHGSIGGLVGYNEMGGIISESFAGGSVTAREGNGAVVGDLVGLNQAGISDSYATGAVTQVFSHKSAAAGGGLVGYNSADSGTVVRSYSIGQVSNFPANEGGLIGFDSAPAGSIANSYWDTDTSGITNLSQGAGNITNDPGITGLTTAQMQSALPSGFDPSVWAENPSINGGFPYLPDNPPP